MFDRLGWLVLRLRFVLVAGWVVGAVAFGLLGPSLSQVGSADETSFLPKSAESLAARQVIAEAFPNDSAPSTALVVFSRSGGLTDADRAAIEGMRAYFEGTATPKRSCDMSPPSIRPRWRRCSAAPTASSSWPASI
jgi:uncharacterized membrane protein YdfJ with MMPL/SSD domain